MTDILIDVTKKGVHANLLIFDKKTMTVERFEPHGTLVETSNNRWFDTQGFDMEMSRVFTALEEVYHAKFEYLTPDVWWYGPGIQEIINLGYCYVIILMWFDIRMTFPDVDRSEISRILSDVLKIDKHDWKTFAQAYIFGIDDGIADYFFTTHSKPIPRTRFPLLKQHKNVEKNI